MIWVFKKSPDKSQTSYFLLCNYIEFIPVTILTRGRQVVQTSIMPRPRVSSWLVSRWQRPCQVQPTSNWCNLWICAICRSRSAICRSRSAICRSRSAICGSTHCATNLQIAQPSLICACIYRLRLLLIRSSKCYIMGEQRASQLSLSRRISSLVSMPSAPSH